MDTGSIYVKVHPKAGKDVLVAMGPGRFEAWLKAKPVQGEANEALIALVARALKIAPQHVRLVKGRAGHHKVLRIIT